MNLNQLYYFSEAVKHGSISVAAEKCFLSQPAFSTSIRNLEKELGVELLLRNNQGVELTEAGEFAYVKAKELLQIVDELKNINNTCRVKNVVRIATIPCICDEILPIAMKKAREKGLNMYLSIQSGESHDVYRDTLAGMADIGLVFESDAINSSEITYKHLFEDEYVLYVGKESPFWNSKTITLKEALDQPYIAYRDEFIKDNGGLSESLSGKIPNIAFRTDDLESIKKIISESDGVAFFHKIMTSDDVYLKAGLIRSIRISDYPLRTKVGYVESKKYGASKASLAFLEILKQTIAEYCSERQ